MSQSEDDRKTTGPSWWDVQRASEELEGAWGGKVQVTMTPQTGKGAAPGKALWVRVELLQRRDGFGKLAVSEGNWWPHTDHRTMPGMLLKMLWDLDWKLVEAKNTAERQAAF